MVSPAAAQLEVTRGVAFEVEPEPLHESERSHVSRLDVRLEAVEPKLLERVLKYEAKRLAHVPLAGEWGADVIAEVGALERAAGDLTELDRAEDGIVLVAPDEEADEGGRPAPREVAEELRRRPRWRDPGVVEGATAPIEREELSLIGATREREMNPGAFPLGG
jgi:hypothetical protein